MSENSANSGAKRRVALVTGGSGGIGRAVVQRLAHDGYAIGVHYSGNRERAQEIVHQVTANGGEAISVQADISDDAAMAEAFDDVESAFGNVDVVVNTAGIMLLSTVQELDLSDFDRMMKTNVRGTFVVSQLAAQRVAQGGALINFSTSQTRLQHPTYAAYAAPHVCGVCSRQGRRRIFDFGARPRITRQGHYRQYSGSGGNSH